MERHHDNPDYPKSEDLVASIQIAAPVSETVDGSPWINFKDDQVLNWIRQVVNVLPGNVNSPGTGASDLRGHGLKSRIGAGLRFSAKELYKMLRQERIALIEQELEKELYGAG